MHHPQFSPTHLRLRQQSSVHQTCKTKQNQTRNTGFCAFGRLKMDNTQVEEKKGQPRPVCSVPLFSTMNQLAPTSTLASFDRHQSAMEGTEQEGHSERQGAGQAHAATSENTPGFIEAVRVWRLSSPKGCGGGRVNTRARCCCGYMYTKAVWATTTRAAISCRGRRRRPGSATGSGCSHCCRQGPWAVSWGI